MTSTLHGGKTAPRFLQDFTVYNPHKLPLSSYNILTELALQFVDGSAPKRTTGKGSCRHKWSLKAQQTNLPELALKPDSSSIYIVAAYCTVCRCHAEIQIDYFSEEEGLVPCPTDEAPLHHFIYQTQAANGRQTFETDDGSESWVDMQHFLCSSLSCSARLSTFFRPPRLKLEWVALLTDRSLIRQRAQKVMDDEPTRFEGHAIPSPIVVLANLRAYVVNAISNPERRRIIGNNKKWLLSLGEPCSDLLKYLGFTREEDDWMPPHPELNAAIPYTSSINKLLDDVEKELLVLIDQQPEEEKRILKINISSSPAILEFERILGSKGYKRSPASRTIDLTEDEHPFYAGLGATRDFHDELIVFSYERQIACDPSNIPYYLECLQEIAKGRASEDLQTMAAIEASSGKISAGDVRRAYKSFDISPDDFFNDDTIIGTFQARIADAPKQEPELRRALRIIGQSRSSARIEQIAANSVTTYKQALSWLGATENLEDGFIISMYSIKVNENPLNEEIGRNAVSLIAETRKSKALLLWLETGDLGEIEMDIGQAYARLGIDDRTLDDETILVTYSLRAEEAPSQIGDLNKAMAAIAKSRNSRSLQNFLGNSSVDSKHHLTEWPVGLENIGNTCYLNSLLQFYFTVKPLRDLVLNFDTYKMSIDHSVLSRKQVGSRRVSTKEVERAQNFVYELQKLFKSMIAASTETVVPEQELARLTLISSTAEESIRRQSVLGGHQPSLGEIYGNPIQGPLPPSLPSTTYADTEMLDSMVENETIPQATTSGQEEDISSEGTLVETPIPDASEDHDFMVIDTTRKRQQEDSNDKENVPPSKSDPSPEIVFKKHSESSTLSPNEQYRKSESGIDYTEEPKDTPMEDVAVLAPPSRPPPVPPRQKPEEQKRAIQEEVEIGAQQDVTEVIANVLFQLQCAIKAETIDESGEQIDQVKSLFFGKQKSYTTNEQGVIRTKEEFISDIKVDVASGPRDIYAALDGAFDVQQVEVGGSLEPQYTTLSQIPPVLQILVQRAQFDPEKKTTFKSNHHLELKETIFMDRYMDLHDADLQNRRQECWKWKKDLAKLESREKQLTETELGLNMSKTLSMTAQYLRQIVAIDTNDAVEVNPEIVEGLEMASDDAKNELSTLHDQIKSLTTSISTQFTDLRGLPYRLHSVFIHRGGVSSGHYWIYIFDFDRNIWRSYNDGYVKEVTDLKEIYDQEPGNRPATPYFLVYVKDDIKDHLVDAVCRDIPDVLEKASSQDTIMIDDDDDDSTHGTAELSRWTGQSFAISDDIVEPKAKQNGNYGDDQWN